MAKQQQADRESQNGHDQDVEQYEQELAGYLRERIKPGLNKGAIPLLARSIARDIAHRERPGGASEEAESEDQPTAEEDDEPRAEEEDDEPRAEEEDDEPRADEEDDEPRAEEEDDVEDGADDDDADEHDAEEDDADATSEAQDVDFEAEMHELQEELGEDWILRFSVQGDDAWLTAEKADGTQRVEAPTAEVLTEAVELLNEGGGRSS